MAWITKNSATMEIAPEGTPLLPDEFKARMRESILPKYAVTQGALLPVLHEVQHHLGYLPYQALIEVAEFLELTPQRVLDTASFYDEFHLEPVGKNIIGVCQSIVCETCGHVALIDHLSHKLGIEPGETTADGLFTLLAMECLGSCDTAPCALFNTDRIDNLSREDIDRFIDETLAAENSKKEEKLQAESTED